MNIIDRFKSISLWKIFAIFAVVAGLIITVWYKDGYLLGVAEDGLTFYNLSNYLQMANYAWMEYPGLGSPALSFIATKPTFIVLSYLQNISIPGFLIQAGVMFFLLVSSGVGIYLLVKELFSNLPMRYVLLSVFFYWFNPISLADVWNRFLLNYIFFFALLPIGSYLYIRGLRSRRYIWTLALNASLILYSYAFSYIAFSILFWLWLSLITFFYALFDKSLKSRIFSFKYFLLTLILFIMVNCWWILPLVNLNLVGGATPTAQLFMKQNNLGTLQALSEKIGNLTGIFKLINSSFLALDSLSWVKLYYSPFLFFSGFFFIGAILLFLLKSLRSRTALFLGSLFFTSIFLMKGSSSPFGEIYSFIFDKILILQVFRNPFEKFGFLLSLSSAVLLGPSLYELIKQRRVNVGKLLYLSFFLIIFFYLGFPLLSGLAFTNTFPPTNNYLVGYKVKVPEYYKSVNDWLNRQGGNFRYMGLPIKEEGITYNWEKGYAGVELGVALFSTSGIIHKTSVPFFNQIIPEIEPLLMSDKDFTSFANLLNVRYFLLRYDIDYKLRDMTAPEILEKRLAEREQNREVKKVATFGKVSIWENLRWRDNTFYVTGKAGDPLPKISYEKINTTRYIVHVKDVVKPYILVFSELYNSAWMAVFPDGRILNNHIRVNVYGNGWNIDRRGDYDVVVEFGPQKYMEIGEKISFASYILIAVGMLVLRMKQKI